MSNENIDHEQITKVPDAKPASKNKDPKKVAAGKNLAEYNKTEKMHLLEKRNVKLILKI